MKCSVAANEFKWKAVEKKQYELDYTKSDVISQQFLNWKIPMRAHTVTWSVPGKLHCFQPSKNPIGHNPDWFEANPTLDALFNRTDDIVLRYAGQVLQWDVLNEPLHGNFFLKSFPDYDGNLWADMISHVKQADPRVKTLINDYNIVRSDKASCYNELTSNVTIDYAGLQGHIHQGVNGHYLKYRLDTLANHKSG